MNDKIDLRKRLLGDNAGIWKISLKSPEGLLFKISLSILALYLIFLLFGLYHNNDLFKNLLAMATTNLFFGRAAAMTLGYTLGLQKNLITYFVAFNEMLLVILFYPLFVFSIRYILVIPALEKFTKSIIETAEKYYPLIRKYGPIGIIIFVWFPFWMTGPVVGSAIGYFMGLSLAVNLLVIFCGNCVAVFFWSAVLYKLHVRITNINPILPAFVFIAFIVVILILGFIFQKKQKK